MKWVCACNKTHICICVGMNVHHSSSLTRFSFIKTCWIILAYLCYLGKPKWNLIMNIIDTMKIPKIQTSSKKSNRKWVLRPYCWKISVNWKDKDNAHPLFSMMRKKSLDKLGVRRIWALNWDWVQPEMSEDWDVILDVCHCKDGPVLCLPGWHWQARMAPAVTVTGPAVSHVKLSCSNTLRPHYSTTTVLPSYSRSGWSRSAVCAVAGATADKEMNRHQCLFYNYQTLVCRSCQRSQSCLPDR